MTQHHSFPVRCYRAFSGIVFVLCLAAALILEAKFGLTQGDREFYWVDHVLFGAGFPFLFVALFGIGVAVAARERSWFPGLGHWIDRCFGWLANGFEIGIVLTVFWSLGNELVIYWIRNPKHGADWQHWFSDIAGMLIAYLLYRRFVKPVPRRVFAG